MKLVGIFLALNRPVIYRTVDRPCPIRDAYLKPLLFLQLSSTSVLESLTSFPTDAHCISQ